MPLRPLAAIWWGYHSLLVLVWGIVLSVFERQMPVTAVCLVALLVIVLGRSTFGYLLLAVTAFTKKQALLYRLWEWRGRWGLAHGALVAAARLVAEVL
jgi:hypothetical protein